MAVKEGYKQAEVGVLPEDWSVATLSEACILSKKKHSPRHSNYNYKCIELEHVEQNTGRLLDYTESKKQLSHKNYFYIGSVLFGKLRPYLRKFHYADFDGVCSTEMWVLLPSVNTDSKYLYYLMQSEPVIEACNKSVGTKMPRADWNIVNNTLIGIPSPPEQKAIATALSDIDGLIDSLSKLIEKKKNIKQGAMQELLTGKKRLEGFSGEWVDVELGNAGYFISGNGFPIRYQSSKKSKYPFYKVSDFNNVGNDIFMSDANNYINENTRRALSAKIIPKDSIIFAKIGAAIYLERKRISSVDCCIDNNMMSFVCDESVINSKTAYYYWLNLKLSDYVSATALPSLSSKDLKNIKIFIPPTIEEQTTIATILSDMDLEIEKLQAKLVKCKAIKKGMMQELLTGRIRLLEGA